jgi:hypothetical protein
MAFANDCCSVEKLDAEGCYSVSGGRCAGRRHSTTHAQLLNAHLSAVPKDYATLRKGNRAGAQRTRVNFDLKWPSF